MLMVFTAQRHQVVQRVVSTLGERDEVVDGERASTGFVAHGAASVSASGECSGALQGGRVADACGVLAVSALGLEALVAWLAVGTTRDGAAAVGRPGLRERARAVEAVAGAHVDTVRTPCSRLRRHPRPFSEGRGGFILDG